VAYFAISCDKPDTNKKFAESLELDYPILSDPDRTVAKAYGVIGEGRSSPQRWTYYIDKEGILRHVDKKVSASNHGVEIVQRLKELGIAQ
jgi:peroxiredoxin Q/BCP